MNLTDSFEEEIRAQQQRAKKMIEEVNLLVERGASKEDAEEYVSLLSLQQNPRVKLVSAERRRLRAVEKKIRPFILQD